MARLKGGLGAGQLSMAVTVLGPNQHRLPWKPTASFPGLVVVVVVGVCVQKSQQI